MSKSIERFSALALALVLLTARSAWPQPDPLPSWNDGASRRAIQSFVADVTREGGADFVAPADRVAVFDNDGTLWSEQPTYFQLAFMVDQVKAAAEKHPEWKDDPTFKALIANDMATVRTNRAKFLEILGIANSGMSVEDYDRTIRAWLETSRHPKSKRPYTDLVYAPMLELLAYLRANGFKTYIVSGGSIEFMRPWAEKAYGIPPEQVIGSLQELRFELKDDSPVLMREPKIAFIDDGPNKPIGIYRAIGRRPIAAFGNSDGDQQMLEYAAAGPGKRLAALIHHDDGEREFAYDRTSEIGKLDKAWDEALAKKWTVVSMKNDWKRIYPFN